MAAQDQEAKLKLELHDRGAETGGLLFKVSLRNETASPLIVCLGEVVGDRKYATSVEFLLTDSNGRVRRLTNRDPQYIAGSVGPYILELPAGGSFDLTDIDLTRYWSHEPQISILKLPPGLYTLVATLDGQDPNKWFVPAPGQPPATKWEQRFWLGHVQSNAWSFKTSQVLGG